MECAGQELLKIDYPKLYERIEIKYGESTDKTKFKLPDFRGKFIRSVNTSTTGIDANRVIGSSQGNSIKNRNHGFSSSQLA